MRGAVAAEMDGFAKRYIDAVFHHVEEPKKMDERHRPRRPRCVRPRRRARPGASRISSEGHAVEKHQPVARGTSARPFFVGEEMFFGKDRLREVEEEIVAQQAR
jgi:hypothetical protein